MSSRFSLVTWCLVLCFTVYVCESVFCFCVFLHIVLSTLLEMYTQSNFKFRFLLRKNMAHYNAAIPSYTLILVIAHFSEFAQTILNVY